MTNVMRQTGKEMKEHKWLVLGMTLISLLLGSVMSLLLSVMLQGVMDSVEQKNLAKASGYFLGDCLVILFYVFCVFMAGYLSLKLNLNIEYRLKDLFTFNITRLKRELPSGEYSRLYHANSQVAGSYSIYINFAISVFSATLIVCYVAFMISWKLLIFMLVLIPIMAFLYSTIGAMQHHIYQIMGQEGKSYSYYNEAVSNIDVIKNYGMQEALSDRFGKLMVDTLRSNMSLVKIQMKAQVMQYLSQILIGVGVPIVCGLLWKIGDVSLGAIFITDVLFFKILNNVKQMIDSYQGIVSLKPPVKLLEDFLSEKEKLEQEETEGSQPAGIRLKDVSFAYREGKAVFEHLNLDVEPGVVTAIVGPSGAGKTTLLKLVLGELIPETGEIEVYDGQRSYARDAFSFVSQEPRLFPVTVYENIEYGSNEELSREQCMEIGKTLECRFIEELPQQYDTVLNQDSSNLSGGQRQSISIARAFAKRAPLILLDEPTSSVDAGMRDEIFCQIQGLCQKSTPVLVTHDITLAKKADKVVFISPDGVFTGTHDSLVQVCASYQHFIENGEEIDEE